MKEVWVIHATDYDLTDHDSNEQQRWVVGIYETQALAEKRMDYMKVQGKLREGTLSESQRRASVDFLWDDTVDRMFGYAELEIYAHDVEVDMTRSENWVFTMNTPSLQANVQPLGKLKTRNSRILRARAKELKNHLWIPPRTKLRAAR